MGGSIAVLLCWLGFGGSHMVLAAPDVRSPIIARVGARGFQALYSLVALATFILLVRTYWGHKHAGPQLWDLAAQPGVRLLAIVLAGIGVAVAVLAVAQPSPTGMRGASKQARGMTRITRHPLFMAIGLWGLAHILVNGFFSDVIFFGGFVVFAVVGSAHQDARKRVTEGDGLGQFYGETSLLPFGAIVTGRNHLALGEIPRPAAVIGIVAAVLLYLLHSRLFG